MNEGTKGKHDALRHFVWALGMVSSGFRSKLIFHLGETMVQVVGHKNCIAEENR